MATNFEKVKEFNTAFDVKRIELNNETFRNDMNYIEFRISLIFFNSSSSFFEIR